MSSVIFRYIMLFSIIGSTSFIMFNFQNCTKSEFSLRGGVTGLSGLNADDDNDGLSNEVEEGTGTDPKDKDSDNDGLTDGEEVNTHGTDPMDPDTDDGGVNDGDEVNNGTNPVDKPGDDKPVNPPEDVDNDNDGLTDVYEKTVSLTDPNDPDSDDDGLLDGEEVNTHKTNPNNPDTDGGSVNDGKEVANGTNPKDNPKDDKGLDSDNDGLTDEYENTQSGTDPQDPDTDDDGLLDGQEVAGPKGNDPTDPKDKDSDDDGLEDGKEVNQYGTNPNDPDTDNGGVKDGPEVTSGTNPLDSKDDGGSPFADDDNDGLTNAVEENLGTDPNNPDTDGDGLKDGPEVLAHGTDPKDKDTDDGGVEDGEEVNVKKTNPLVKDDDLVDPNKDTDNDGLTDIVETTTGTDPKDPDSDDDGLKDGPEVLTYKTNPMNPDTDGGGVNDGAEVQQGSNPRDNPKDDKIDPNADDDKDGLTNAQEAELGTDPNDPDTDDDGLKDGAEVNSYKTDPKDPDTDDGGVDDGVEVSRGSNPKDKKDDLVNSSNCKPYQALAVWSDPANTKQTANSLYLGKLENYTSEKTGIANYKYSSASAHPFVGPKPEDGVMKVFLHKGSDGVTASFFLNRDNAAPKVGRIAMNITTAGNNQTDNVLLSDDSGELKRITSAGGINKYTVKMAYSKNTDGGVIGPFNTNNFLIHFELLSSESVERIEVHSLDGKVYDVKGTHFIVGYRNYLDCSCENTDNKITFTNMPQPVGIDRSGEVVFDTNFNTGSTASCFFNDVEVPNGCFVNNPVNFNEFFTGEHQFKVVTKDADGVQCEASFKWEIQGEPCLDCGPNRKPDGDIDSDGDGLTDEDETNKYGTDPNDPDTDNGGVKDGDEVTRGSDPLKKEDDNGDPNGDPDQDGIKTGDEVEKYKTDPNNPDTDGDGLKDGHEVNSSKTDPNNPDSDADGLKDGPEITEYGTDPLKKDTDNGGVNDGEEVKNGTNPASNPGDDNKDPNVVILDIDGGWSDWSVWKEVGNCGPDKTIKVIRERKCNNPVPVNNGALCKGVTDKALTVETEASTGKCTPPAGTWGPWSKYIKLGECVGGKQLAKTERICRPHPTGSLECKKTDGSFGANEIKEVKIDCTMRPIDGGWSKWTKWAARSQCDPNTQTRVWSRGRTCNSPTPRHKGKRCINLEGKPAIAELQKDNKACNPKPIDGGWSVWGEWKPLSSDCNPKTLKRAWVRDRSCTNPKPQFKGRACVGNEQEKTLRTCDPKPVNGGWAAWSKWAPITACNPKTLTRKFARKRTCSKPSPQWGGKLCVTMAGRAGKYETQVDTKECAMPPVNGGWSNWTAWVEQPLCNPKSRTKLAKRARKCNNPAPLHGGKNCVGKPFEQKTIKCTPAPVDGGWTVWSKPVLKSTCQPTPNGKYVTYYEQRRTCSNPAAAYGGAKCAGKGVKSVEVVCKPINAGWSAWNKWKPITACNAQTLKRKWRRTRTCNNPVAKYGGANCTGLKYEDALRACKPAPVNGAWNAWSVWKETSPCNPQTLLRTMRRSRVCNKPAPQWGGKLCVTVKGAQAKVEVQDDKVECKMPPINGGWSAWTSWKPTTACNPATKTRTIVRARKCDNPQPQFGGAKCAGVATQSRQQACTPPPVNGGWSVWSKWTLKNKCRKVGAKWLVTYQATRACTSPAPSFGGKSCIGETTKVSNQACQPIYGAWGNWSAWSQGACQAGKSLRTSSRVCNGPEECIEGTGKLYAKGSLQRRQKTESCVGVWSGWSAWTYGACVNNVKQASRKRTCRSDGSGALCSVNGKWLKVHNETKTIKGCALQCSVANPPANIAQQLFKDRSGIYFHSSYMKETGNTIVRPGEWNRFVKYEKCTQYGKTTWKIKDYTGPVKDGEVFGLYGYGGNSSDYKVPCTMTNGGRCVKNWLDGRPHGYSSCSSRVATGKRPVLVDRLVNGKKLRFCNKSSVGQPVVTGDPRCGGGVWNNWSAWECYKGHRARWRTCKDGKKCWTGSTCKSKMDEHRKNEACNKNDGPFGGNGMICGYKKHSNTLFSVEAECFNERTSVQGISWNKVAKSGASGDGMCMVTSPDRGVKKSGSSNSPMLTYAVNFAEAGRYEVWVRGWGDADTSNRSIASNSNGEGKSDSIHVGINGNLPSGAHQMDNFPRGGWNWSNDRKGTRSKAYIDVPSAGVHTINVWMREDGLFFDKIVFSKGRYTPRGTGPN